MKRCSRCKEFKEPSAFHKNARKADGLHSECKECQLAFYNKNRSRILEYNKLWNRKNPEAIKSHNERRAISTRGRAKILWYGARERAVKNGLEFNLTVDYIELFLIIGFCQKTGWRFDLSKQGRYKFNPFSPSVDKIDPFGGYTFNNVQIVCTAYNIGKGQSTDEEFLKLCKAVAERNK